MLQSSGLGGEGTEGWEGSRSAFESKSTALRTPPLAPFLDGGSSPTGFACASSLSDGHADLFTASAACRVARQRDPPRSCPFTVQVRTD